jgi:hypothetical protein
MLAATTDTPDGYLFAPSDIAVDHPTNGSATRIIVAGRRRQLITEPDGWSSYQPSGGGVLFGNLTDEGSITFTNSVSFWSEQLSSVWPAENDLTNYEPVQVIVNRRAGRSIAYVLWSPPSAEGLYCDSDSEDPETTAPKCESILTAHDLTDLTVKHLGPSPVYDGGGKSQYGGRMAMTLLGSPVGSTRLAIGAGSLFSVVHDYQEQGSGFSGSLQHITSTTKVTVGLAQTDSRLLWLAEQVDDGPGEPAKLLVFNLTCPAPN